jgi:hypothetical protein
MIEDIFASMRSLSDLLEERLDQKLALTIQLGIVNQDISRCREILERLSGTGRRINPARSFGARVNRTTLPLCPRQCGRQVASRAAKFCKECRGEVQRERNHQRWRAGGYRTAVPFKIAASE